MGLMDKDFAATLPIVPAEQLTKGDFFHLVSKKGKVFAVKWQVVKVQASSTGVKLSFVNNDMSPSQKHFRKGEKVALDNF